jgi:hypothetical protein
VRVQALGDSVKCTSCSACGLRGCTSSMGSAPDATWAWLASRD